MSDATRHVVRYWSATAAPAKMPAYVAFFRAHVRPSLEAIAGFVDAQVLTRDLDGAARTEIVVLTRWRSLEAVRAFAGDDLERAVVEPEARALLLDCDDRVRLYCVEDASSG